MSHLYTNNYKIKNKPKHYDIVNLTSIPEFIINRNKKFDPKILNEIALLIKPYCKKLAFGQNQNIETYTTYNHSIIDLKEEMIKNDKDQQLVQVKNKSKLPNNSIKTVSTVTGYLKQLPNDYFIFNNVKIPGIRENLGHIVIGPNGFFLIKTKKYKGFYIVKDEEWFYRTGIEYTKKVHNPPGKQAMANAISLRKFLIKKGVNMNGIWVNSIVTIQKINFKLEQKPTRHNVLSPSKIPEFILNNKNSIDINIIKESAILIAPYSKNFININNR